MLPLDQRISRPHWPWPEATSFKSPSVPVPLFRRFDLLERRIAGANDPDRRHHRRRRVPRGLAKPTLDKRLATTGAGDSSRDESVQVPGGPAYSQTATLQRSLYAESVTYRSKTATLERFCIGPPSLIESLPQTGTASWHTAGNACGAPVAQVQGGDSEARWNGAHGRKADRTSGAACV